jgi:protein-L-isoaspartate(D-aspartate) O-methyltransferase
MEDFGPRRDAMVRDQLMGRGIVDVRVLNAMRQVPRERFLDAAHRAYAYADEPVQIGEAQTMSQPYIVAKMTQEACIESSDVVLEVGTGSGYAAAVASQLARDVYGVERIGSLADIAAERLARLGFLNVHVKHGDGSLGWAEHAPFDVILVPAAPAEIPTLLLEQLAIGGRLVIPVGSRWTQLLTRVRRLSRTEYAQEPLELVQFVPLLPGVRAKPAA